MATKRERKDNSQKNVLKILNAPDKTRKIEIIDPGVYNFYTGPRPLACPSFEKAKFYVPIQGHEKGQKVASGIQMNK